MVGRSGGRGISPTLLWTLFFVPPTTKLNIVTFQSPSNLPISPLFTRWDPAIALPTIGELVAITPSPIFLSRGLNFLLVPY
ncbi:hypothetical protein EDD16DRAFT_1646054 [Pisolithus croceorrhizus]|nr:hypothetical protein EDD16DRAFT_1646054 [Pisolithus croceorrhizus]KAI6141141.1 hypothetical protein EDD17DRAFT_1667204 [Pisolithus thermaeus]